MHIDTDAGRDGDNDFEAAFGELADAPADKAREEADDQGGPAGADAPATNDGAPAPSDAAPSDDPWATADPKLREERDRLIQERDRAVHSDQSQRGRVAALQRKYEEAVAPRKPQTAEGAEGSEAAEADATKAARRKQLREDYSDVAAPILDDMDEMVARLAALEAVASNVTEDREAARIQAEVNALAAQHPDWQEIAVADDFKNWLKAQPEFVQEGANSEDARAVGIALKLFKNERDEAIRAAGGDVVPDPKPDARRQRQLEGSRQVSSRQAPVATGDPNEFDGAFASIAARKEKQAAAVR